PRPDPRRPPGPAAARPPGAFTGTRGHHRRPCPLRGAVPHQYLAAPDRPGRISPTLASDRTGRRNLVLRTLPGRRVGTSPARTESGPAAGVHPQWSQWASSATGPRAPASGVGDTAALRRGDAHRGSVGLPPTGGRGRPRPRSARPFVPTRGGGRVPGSAPDPVADAACRGPRGDRRSVPG